MIAKRTLPVYTYNKQKRCYEPCNKSFEIQMNIFPECNFLIQIKTKFTSDLYWIVEKIDTYPFQKTKYICMRCGDYKTCSNGINSNIIRKWKKDHKDLISAMSTKSEIDIVSNALNYIIFKNIPFACWNDEYFRDMFQFSLPFIDFKDYLKIHENENFQIFKKVFFIQRLFFNNIR